MLDYTFFSISNEFYVWTMAVKFVFLLLKVSHKLFLAKMDSDENKNLQIDSEATMIESIKLSKVFWKTLICFIGNQCE